MLSIGIVGLPNVGKFPILPPLLAGQQNRPPSAELGRGRGGSSIRQPRFALGESGQLFSRYA